MVITEQLWGLYGYFLICYRARCAPREAWTRLGRAETSEKARVVSDSIKMRSCHGDNTEWLPSSADPEGAYERIHEKSTLSDVHHFYRFTRL